MRPAKKFLLPFLLGATSVLGFAPFGWYWLPIIALAVLFHLWSRQSRREAAASGYFFGLGFFLFGVSWIHVSLHQYGGMPLFLSVIATFLFCAFISLYPALAGYLTGFFPHRLLAAPALWMLCEWLKGWLFTGFPWLSLGYSQLPSALSGYAPIFGVYGVSLAAAASSALIVLLLRSKKALAALALLWLGGFLLGKIEWTTPVGPPVSVSLLQGNIPQDMKWLDDNADATLKIYRDLALKSRAKIVIMPETAIPMFYDEIPEEYLYGLFSNARDRNADILIGIPERHGDEYYNSMFNFGVSPREVYRKSHLVPFGEFLPLRFLFGWILEYLHIPMSDFSRGDLSQKPMDAGGQKLAIDICYEDVFGEEVIRQLPEASALVNVSNDAWFGDSIAPRQHLQISAMRALETGRMMLRATNTGMTAIVDRYGRVVKILPAFARGALDGELQGYSGSTPYVRFGNLAALLIAFILVALASKKGLKSG